MHSYPHAVVMYPLNFIFVWFTVNEMVGIWIKIEVPVSFSNIEVFLSVP